MDPFEDEPHDDCESDAMKQKHVGTCRFRSGSPRAGSWLGTRLGPKKMKQVYAV